MKKIKWPKWTVLYNIPNDWVGTGWEFYNTERAAEIAYNRHTTIGNYPCKRPFYLKCDRKHLGAAHQKGKEE